MRCNDRHLYFISIIIDFKEKYCYYTSKDEVYECFEQIVKNRKKVRVEPIIDEYSRFLFLDKKDMPEVVLHWEKHFQWALGKYNRTHEEQMPKITPHGRVIIRTS